MALYNVTTDAGRVWVTRTALDPTVEARIVVEQPWGLAERALKRHGLTLSEVAARALTPDGDPERMPRLANG